ncbi:hypothetical protein T484DRAFT_1814833 [Baffinella frigidus]|nr:hypothetical protein T484DRAFT_1814833 [Cryptophyta sp. CCMP2293]
MGALDDDASGGGQRFALNDSTGEDPEGRKGQKVPGGKPEQGKQKVLGGKPEQGKQA